MRHSLDKIATTTLRFILPLAALLVPLFFLPLTTNFYNYNKTYLIYLIASLALIAWTVRILVRRRFLLTLTPATLPVLGLCLVYLLSSFIQSPITITSLLGKTALLISLTIIFISTTSSQKNEFVINATIISLFISSLILSFISLGQYLGLGQSLTSIPWLASKSFNPAGGPIPYLTLAFILLPGTIYLAFKTRNSFTKISLFLLAALTLTASISHISLLLEQSKTNNLPLIIFLPFTVGWSITLDIFKNLRTALLGSGPETFLTAFTRLRPASLNLTPLWNTRFNNSSNELFQIITTTGLLGGLFWLTSFLRPLTSFYKTKLIPPVNKTIPIFSLITLFASFLALLLSPGNALSLSLAFIALALSSLSYKLNSSATKDVTLGLFAAPSLKQSPDYDLLPTSSKSPGSQVLPWIFALPSLILLIIFWSFAAKTYAANLTAYKAYQIINTSLLESYNLQDDIYRLDPYNPDYRINFSQTSLIIATNIASKGEDLTDQDRNNISQLVQQSIREAKNATQINPRSVAAWENLASVYNQLTNFAEGAIDWTIASYNQAILLDPTNPRLRLNLGSVFFSLGDNDQALRIFSQAVDLKPDWPNAHYNLAAAYSANKNYQKALAEMRIVVQLLDPNSDDYQKAQDELSQLEKQVQAATPSQPAPQTPPSEEGQNIELVTPTPIPSPTTPIELPEDSGPEIPPPETEPTPTEAEPTPSPTPPGETTP